MIVAFVGIDGSGKTTLLNLFAKYLEERGRQVYIIKALTQKSSFMINYNNLRDEFRLKHPEKKHEFNVISSYIMSFDLLQQSEKIKEMDSGDKVIILDRWAICQQLYAKVWMAENDFAKMAYQMCLVPDLTFVIDADLNIVEHRIENRGGANEYENIYCLERLKKLYLKYAAEHNAAVLIENNSELSEAYLDIIREYNARNFWRM